MGSGRARGKCAAYISPDPPSPAAAPQLGEFNSDSTLVTITNWIDHPAGKMNLLVVNFESNFRLGLNSIFSSM